ncbi:TPA: hypothetical protein ACFP38_000544 [Neisseria subflava]
MSISSGLSRRAMVEKRGCVSTSYKIHAGLFVHAVLKLPSHTPV